MEGEIETRAEGNIRKGPPVPEKGRAITGREGGPALGEGAVPQKVQAEGELLGLFRFIGPARQRNQGEKKREEDYFFSDGRLLVG